MIALLTAAEYHTLVVLVNERRLLTIITVRQEVPVNLFRYLLELSSAWSAESTCSTIRNWTHMPDSDTEAGVKR